MSDDDDDGFTTNNLVAEACNMGSPSSLMTQEAYSPNKENRAADNLTSSRNTNTVLIAASSSSVAAIGNSSSNPTVAVPTAVEAYDAKESASDDTHMQINDDTQCSDSLKSPPNAIENLESTRAANDGSSDDYDDNDDDSDDSSSDDEEQHHLSLQERRRINMANNKKHLVALGLMNAKQSPKPNSNNKVRLTTEETATEDLPPEKRYSSMIRKHTQSTEHQRDLVIKYPGRTGQIRLLRASLQSTVAQLQNNSSVYVPPPIFCTGPSGTGKTSIVRHVISSIVQEEEEKQRIATSYINCATLEPLSVEALVERAHSQIMTTFRPQRRRKRLLSKVGKTASTTYADGMEDVIEQARVAAETDEHPATKVAKAKTTDRFRYSRAAKESNGVNNTSKRKLLEDQQTAISISASQGAPLAFGRSLVPVLGSRNAGGCAFLVLDNAERLMTLHRNGSTKSNFLSQFLLMPKVSELNLTIIVISKCSLLMDSRLDNASSLDKSVCSINLGIHPIRVHFSSYSGNDMFKSILQTPDNLSAMVGMDFINDNEFHKLLVSSFVSSVVQATSGMTRDVSNMIAAGRRLWPMYIEPLNSVNIESTMKAIDQKTEDKQQAFLSYVNQRMIKLSKMIEVIFLFLDNMEDEHSCNNDFPYLTKCLLIAAFICQHNKATTDKQLFTVSANGQRRKNSTVHGQDDDADGAFSTWDQQRTKALRPRAFPLERLISVFVNIVGLNDGKDLEMQQGEEMQHFVASLGNSVFLETVSQLRALGLLREVAGDNGAIPLSSPMYCCDLERDVADRLADSVGFDLEKYLLSR